LPAKAGLRALDEIENEAKQKVATTAQTELLGSIGRPPSEVYSLKAAQRYRFTYDL
jgi:hypothetical protein